MGNFRNREIGKRILIIVLRDLPAIGGKKTARIPRKTSELHMMSAG